MSWCIKVDILGRLCDNNLGRLYNHFTTTNVYLIGAAYNAYFLIIYKPLSLIIFPWIFNTQLGAGTAWFCLSQCAIPFCTLSLARGLRPTYCVREDFQSRIRRVESSHLVFGKGAVLLFRPCYVWEFGGFLCLTFFVGSLLCNLNKIL